MITSPRRFARAMPSRTLPMSFIERASSPAAHSTGHFAASAAEAVDRLREAFGALRPKDPWQLAGTIFTHTVFVGVPIALAAKRFLNQD